LWEWANQVQTPEDLSEVFLAKHGVGMTAWGIAAERGDLEVLHTLWKWANQILSPEEIRNYMFLAIDNQGRPAWHTAAEKGNIEIAHTFYSPSRPLVGCTG
jgi:ankyrin repeat protein